MRSHLRLAALLALAVATALATMPLRPLAQAAPTEACTAGDDCSFYLANSFKGGAADAAFAVGGRPNAVTVGDWDGDGTDTVGTRSGANFTLLASAATCADTTIFPYGRVGDQVLVGDWDGDGVDTLVVRRGSRWYMRNDLRSGIAQTTVTYGRAADTAIVGDWDGDGTDTPGVYRGARPAYACNASAIQKEWAARGGANGSLGTATSSETTVNGISTQTFQNGRLSWTAASGVIATGTGGQAVGGSRFDAAIIISDAEFFNSAAMDASAIRSFLAEKNPSCKAANDGTSCLKDYRATTKTMTSAYCRTYPGGTNEDAATVIAKTAAACGINPRVLLVILQKEQGLVLATGDTLTATRYAKATGLHCSDTSPCDPTYAGLPSQIYYAASRLVQYGVEPDVFTYRAGQVTTVANNPNSGCGSQTVPILNRATAALYNYTPYVPNVAALNNMYGSGDARSAYGNRNFWRYYRTWFGSTGV